MIDHRRAGVMRAGGDDFDLRQAGFAGEFHFQRAEPRAGRAEGREHGLAQPERAEKFFRPRPGLRIVKLRGAGERNFVSGDAGTEIVKRVADEQKLFRTGQPFGRFGGKLVNRVQRHELDAGLGVGCRPVHARPGVFNAGRRARVAITPHRRHHPPASVEKHVVHAPRISADAGDGQLARGGLFQAGLQLVEQAVNVPMQRAAGFDRAVGKAMQILQDNFAAGERAEYKTAAVRAEVAGEIMRGHMDEPGRILTGAMCMSKKFEAGWRHGMPLSGMTRLQTIMTKERPSPNEQPDWRNRRWVI